MATEKKQKANRTEKQDEDKKENKENKENNSFIEITDKNFDSIVKKGDVVVDFYADWCMPCLMLAPILEELAVNNPDVTFARLNIDENKEKSKEHQVFSIPTLLFFKNGTLVERTTGALSYEMLQEKLKKLI